MLMALCYHATKQLGKIIIINTTNYQQQDFSNNKTVII